MMDTLFTVDEIARLVGGRVEGEGSTPVHGVAPVDSAAAGELTFAADERWATRLANSKAAAAIVGVWPASAAMPLIRVSDVQAAMAILLSRLSPPTDFPPPGRHPSAVVAADAEIAPDAAIGPHVVIGARAKVGAGCILCSGVAVGSDVEIGEGSILDEGVVVKTDCKIGRRVRIGCNSVIGFEGFGYFTTGGVHHKIPHVGNVIVEDDVEFGACTCVDRAKFGSTRVGAGTKVDNLVQIAHNVQIGHGCILVGQCGVAGSAKLGDYVVLGGHAGIRDNISLGNGVQCAAFAAVAGNVADGEIVVGIPAGPAREKLRAIQAVDKLPELLKRVKKLEARLEALESPKDNQ